MVFTPLRNKHGDTIGWTTNPEMLRKMNEERITEVVSTYMEHASIPDQSGAPAKRKAFQGAITRCIDEARASSEKHDFIIDLYPFGGNYCRIACLQKFNGDTVNLLTSLNYIPKDNWYVLVEHTYISGANQVRFTLLRAKTLLKRYHNLLCNYSYMWEKHMGHIFDQAGGADARWKCDDAITE